MGWNFDEMVIQKNEQEAEDHLGRVFAAGMRGDPLSEVMRRYRWTESSSLSDHDIFEAYREGERHVDAIHEHHEYLARRRESRPRRMSMPLKWRMV